MRSLRSRCDGGVLRDNVMEEYCERAANLGVGALVLFL